MISLGIIWNSAQEYKEEIIYDLSKRVEVTDCFDLYLGEDYKDFVRDIYDSENMEPWKINHKLAYMDLHPSANISVIYFEFDETESFYHPMKRKEVYKNLEGTKMFIREKYKEKVENYTFDIVFHTADSLEEFKNCHTIVKKYLEERKVKEAQESKNYT